MSGVRPARHTFGKPCGVMQAGQGARHALTGAQREAVHRRRLTPGTRPPSPRRLAADLEVARNTMATVYGDLVAEHRLTARAGSGPHRSDTMSARRPWPAQPPGHPESPATPPPQALRRQRISPCCLAEGHTLRPRRGSSRRVRLRRPHGRPELRTVLADRLARARTTYRSTPASAIASGSPQSPGGSQARSVAIDSCGPDRNRGVLTATRLETLPLPGNPRNRPASA